MRLFEDDLNTLVAIAQKYGVIALSVFGSYARDEATPASDIDVLVEFEAGRSLFDLVRLERELRGALRRHIDVVTPNSLHPDIRRRVLDEKVSVL